MAFDNYQSKYLGSSRSKTKAMKILNEGGS